MTDPNSLLSLIRRAIVKAIEPKPDRGEAWCIDCRLNKGRSLIIPADGIETHLNTHDGSESVTIDARWR